MSKRKEVSEDIKKLLEEVCTHFDSEDRSVRERQIRLWKKLKYYWAGHFRLWWSEVAHDWRVFDSTYGTDFSQSSESSFYDKPVNVYRAYLESIIAALSVIIPSIQCLPDDADNPLDIATAKAGDKIASLIGKHNDVSLLWVHALYILSTESMIAARTYTIKDEKYGTYDVEEYEDEEVDQQYKVCPLCETEMADENQSNNEMDEFNPDGMDQLSHYLINSAGSICPNCLAQVDPEFRARKAIVRRLVGVTKEPKSRIKFEAYGGLNVKVPNYARKQEDIPYLIYAYDTHYSKAIEMYPWLEDNRNKNSKISQGAGGMHDPYEKWGRLPVQYYGEYPINTVTIRSIWLRPCAFNILSEESDVNKLKKLYPDGVKVVYVDDQYAEAHNAQLDDEWTLTYNPLGDYIHGEPLGAALTSVQEITNDIISLVLQTMEHGVPQTFADPSVLNFQGYQQLEVAPGSIVPATAKTGKSVADGFYTVKTAMLSGEVLPFAEKVQELGQLVSGALPSLFGGAQESGSKTAAQYSMSRAQALQRLQTSWKMLNIWWKNIFGKAIPAYIKEVQDDEHWVEKDQNDNFINVFIRVAELSGKIGSIELESSEQLPSTYGQKKDVIMQLLQGGNPEIMQAIGSSENIPLLAEAIGLEDFYIPGADDREKQYEEIKLLVNSSPFTIPIPPNPMNPMGGQEEVASVNIEPEIDNNEIHIEICKKFLISSTGRLLKTENPQGYKNVLLHLKEHSDYIQNMMMQQQMMQMQMSQNQNNSKSDSEPKAKPPAAKLPQGASNVSS